MHSRAWPVPKSYLSPREVQLLVLPHCCVKGAAASYAARWPNTFSGRIAGSAGLFCVHAMANASEVWVWRSEAVATGGGAHGYAEVRAPQRVRAVTIRQLRELAFA